MTTWRPVPRIRFKALGLHWRDGRLLAAEVLDDAGRVKGVRPLGGSVEFGETAEAAVIREFHEELGIAVTILGPPVFMENIYAHEGAQGHEVLAIFDVAFPNEALSGAIRVEFHEDDGSRCFAEWYDLDALDLPDGPQLYPEGLKAHLLRPR
ncbi:DNA mismatch repair protein MutT [Haematobacter massiliensis]|uniref:DNA mismatch repair protein MutT n=1 Tax=Haematobacter massiliensis TaxID=195105 RepID=A0A086Y4J9_9RHOB|nr:NUDIX domain-containing protein [Haematobacter massiliensis]KFI29199.1 DNA mismatch repair protein MutT [Haematobacter massiliensis]OWJ71426.1 DNA mismatch repair protein MutT [Haematobacter massiliensis]OWJ83999.1 DNA mismatch repair protein MutT [Haematobacter massiliensis]